MLSVNIRRHLECGFQLGAGETREAVIGEMQRVFGRSPVDLQMFSDPAEDIEHDLEALRHLGWLEGTRIAGYVIDLHTKESVLVGEFTASDPLQHRAAPLNLKR